jgi:hypothetical protein
MRDIRRGDPESPHPYENLLPIVELLLAHGNELVEGPDRHVPLAGTDVFVLERDGPVCNLGWPIDIDLVRSEFVLPADIRGSEDGILDISTWCRISGPGERTWISRGPGGS